MYCTPSVEQQELQLICIAVFTFHFTGSIIYVTITPSYKLFSSYIELVLQQHNVLLHKIRHIRHNNKV